MTPCNLIDVCDSSSPLLCKLPFQEPNLLLLWRYYVCFPCYHTIRCHNQNKNTKLKYVTIKLNYKCNLCLFYIMIYLWTVATQCSSVECNYELLDSKPGLHLIRVLLVEHGTGHNGIHVNEFSPWLVMTKYYSFIRQNIPAEHTKPRSFQQP
jgi:hypothetical protein